MTLNLEETQIRECHWEGILTGDTDENPPKLIVICGDKHIGDPQVKAIENGAWSVQFAIPPENINGGTQTFFIGRPEEEPLFSFTIGAGETPDGQLQAEVALLRAELDMLKRAFRRQFAKNQG